MLSIFCKSHVKSWRNQTRPAKNNKNLDEYNWEGINYTWEKDDLKKLEKKNLAISLNSLYTKKEKIYPVYVSKHNSDRGKQFILLIIPGGERWHYITVKQLPDLLRGIASKHHGDFYYLNHFHSFRTKSKLKSQKSIIK